ncbi:MAG TPA: histidine kinase [Solirubrobacter sp.]|nr:histidine kinase [Solirubrobacter sp.]
MTRRAGFALLSVLAVAAVSVAVARHGPEWALAGTSGWRLIVEITAGIALAVAGAVVLSRGPDRTSGALLCAAAAAWMITGWDYPGAPGAVVFTLGIVLGKTAPALLAHALLVHGRGRLGTVVERVAVGAAYAGLTAAAGLGAALFADPRASGCSSCPANLVGLADAPAAEAWFERWGTWVGTAALAVIALLVVRRTWHSSAAARRTIAPVLVPGVTYLALVVIHQVHDLRRGWEGTDRLDDALHIAEAIALLGVAAGIGWQRLAAWRIRGRLARLVVQMAGAVRPGGLRELMASALEDPTLELAYAFEDGWIDTAGRRRPPPAAGDRGQTALVQDGEVIAVLFHRPGLLDDPRLVEELGSAARLAIDHERLQAQQRAQLDRLRSARAAIVAAADAERRRLERDLHDGAQQALAGLAMAIGVARGVNANSGQLAAAQAAVRAALDAVRVMAHATYPAALDEAGLGAALEVLSEWRPHVELATIPDEERFDPSLEAGVYFIIAALTRPTAASVVVDIDRNDDRLIVAVRTAAAGDLTEVRDRVGALGGEIAVDEAPSGETLVRVELACA